MKADIAKGRGQKAEGRRQKGKDIDWLRFQYLARVKSCLGDCYKCRCVFACKQTFRIGSKRT
jgi:hypothetical protein